MTRTKRIVGTLAAWGAMVIGISAVGLCGLAPTASATTAVLLSSNSATFIPSLFPATAQEFNSGHATAWDAFVSDVEYRRIYSCMLSKGYTLPSELPNLSATHPTLRDNTQYPDLKLLDAGSFGQGVGASSSSPETNSNVPSSVRPAWSADMQKCSLNAGSPFNKIWSELAPMNSIWGTDLHGLTEVPSVSSAIADWSRCVAKGGVQVKTINDFFGYVDNAEVQSGASDPTHSPQVRALAMLYGHCIGPVSNAMDAQRIKDRQYILDRFAPQLNRIQQQMESIVQAYSRRYGIRYR